MNNLLNDKESGYVTLLASELNLIIFDAKVKTSDSDGLLETTNGRIISNSKENAQEFIKNKYRDKLCSFSLNVSEDQTMQVLSAEHVDLK